MPAPDDRPFYRGMTSRADLLIQLWNLDPLDEVSTFVAGSSERLPLSPDEVAAEYEAVEAQLAESREQVDDLIGQLEDVLAVVRRTSKSDLETVRRELAELDTEIEATLAEHRPEEPEPAAR